MAFNNRNNLSNESAPWGREVEQKIESNAYDLNQLRLLTENNNRAVSGTLKSVEEVLRFTQPTTQLLFDMEDHNSFTYNEKFLSWSSAGATYSGGAWRLPEKALNIQSLVGDPTAIPYSGGVATPKLYAYIRLNIFSRFNVSSQFAPGYNYEMGATVGYASIDSPTYFQDYTQISTNASYGVLEGVLESGTVRTAETWMCDVTALKTDLLRVQPYCYAPYTSATPTTCTMSVDFSVKFEVRYTLSKNRKQL